MKQSQELVESIREAVNRVAARLVNEFSVRFLVLFGSAATGETGPMSDIDLAVYVDPNRHKSGNIETVLEIGLVLERAIGDKNIDVVILNDATPAIKFNVIRTGIQIMSTKQGDYEDFYVRTLAEYYDFIPFLNRQYESAKASLRGGM